MGNWYEIARYPHSFEKGLVAVTANYRMLEDGTVRVVNLGRKDSLNGEYDAAIGRAKIPDPEEPGKLKVSFFWIFYADYYILELDTVDYNYALIGSSDPDFLWILGRKPQMDDHTYQMLVTNARERGYDISKLNKVPQPEY
jgi:lipocalin